jgi:hypothetical protein
MLAFLTGSARAPGLSDRKERLFACACCRRIWARTEARGRLAIEAAEGYADGRATLEQLERAHAAAWDAMMEEIPGFGLRTPRFYPVNAAWYAAAEEGAVFGGYASAASSCVLAALDEATRAEEKVAQAGLLRDIIGNPFRPLPSRPFPAEVRALAEACYAALPEQSPELGLLADALADQGEEEAATHLRQGSHARGCHILDWVVGRG